MFAIDTQKLIDLAKALCDDTPKRDAINAAAAELVRLAIWFERMQKPDAKPQPSGVDTSLGALVAFLAGVMAGGECDCPNCTAAREAAAKEGKGEGLNS